MLRLAEKLSRSIKASLATAYNKLPAYLLATSLCNNRGTFRHLDWTVPREWNVRAACVVINYGQKKWWPFGAEIIYDGRASWLEIVSEAFYRRIRMVFD